MDERAAVAVAAVRAVETTDRARTVWSDADRAWASRAAAEVLGESADASAFIARRAQLALERLAERKHRIARLARSWRWRPWVGHLTVAAAFIGGALADSIGTSQRINILSPPVLGVVLWNVAMYVVLFGRLVVRYGETASPGPLARALTWLAGGARSAIGARDEATSAFVAQWSAEASPLYAARAGRILHLAAAALALGLIAGLYVRGLGLDFRATWQSTFLEASTVQTLAAAFYAPGALVTGLAVPGADGIAAMRAPQDVSAALWLHLMAATLAAIVVVPRLALAAAAALVERHRGSRLLADLDDAYFARLLRGYRGGAVAVDVVPYSYTLASEAKEGIGTLLARAMGGAATVNVAPPVAYGEEDAWQPPRRSVLVALFNATATPEAEAHGRFLAAAVASGATLVTMVDESSLRGGERRALWEALAREHGQAPVFVDLANPDLDAVEAAFAGVR
jgi:hypothetical protein